MFRPRVIPVLLLKGEGLVKSKAFKDYRYIGDPINAVRIFNDAKADELAFLDIQATKENRLISLDFVRDVGEEANMPFAVGGGIRTIEDIRAIIAAGAEKVIIGTTAAENPDFISKAADAFGTSTIAVCIDVKKKFLGGQQIVVRNGSKGISNGIVEFALMMQARGAGELLVQSVDRDGMVNGYDLELIRSISQSVTIPVVALGGAGNLPHFKQAFFDARASAVAAGSMFVYHGANKGVLINYPEKKELNLLFL